MIKANLRPLITFLLFSLAAVNAENKIYAAVQRPLTVDDLLRLEKIHLDNAWSPFAFSPDGKWLAYVLMRPKSSARQYKLDFLGGLDRGDIWIIDTSGGTPLNITNGSIDGSGYWWPIWSPDGKRLTMLSTKGNGNVRLWVWERASGELKQMSDRGIDQGVDVGLSPTWIGDHQLLFSVLPEGRQYMRMTIEKRAADIATRKWPKAWSGKEVTASVLKSAAPLPFEPKGQLLLADLTKGNTKVLAADNYRGLSISPDKRHFAIFKDVTRSEEEKTQLAVLSLQGKQESISPVIENFTDPRAKWSPDGRELALFENNRSSLIEERRKDQPRHVYRYRIADGSLTEVIGDDLKNTGDLLRPADVIWSTKGNLIVKAERKISSMTPGSKRADWWLIEASGKYRNLTAMMKSVPVQLLCETIGESFIGISDGDLWRISVDGTPPVNLTEKLKPKVLSIVKLQHSKGIDHEPIVIRTLHGTEQEFYSVNLTSGQITALVKPTAKAELVAISAEENIAIFGANMRDGSYLWLKSGVQAKPRIIVETNTFVRDIAEGEIKAIEYRSLDGRDLAGWIILPIDYEQGKKYPLVTWVYAGTIAGEKPDPLFHINFEHTLNRQMLAARGYAVLIPSMPLKPYGEASDPYTELTKGVLPAVDKVVELGIADPKRIAVIGHSYGGYSTYGLITQTNRFKAAVAMAGTSDLLSKYGIFDARTRYDELNRNNDIDFFFSTYWSEGGQGRMGIPPWKDAERYLRNSPLSYADRVETPVMIVQGDMDFVPIQQGEQFFTALKRQGKRAQFVRYWGEGHVLDSPANIRDMWHRIYAWFDEFLDISRDQKGNLLWDSEKVRSRNGSSPLKPEDFARFDQMILKGSQSVQADRHDVAKP